MRARMGGKPAKPAMRALPGRRWVWLNQPQLPQQVLPSGCSGAMVAG
jgi:hypothetical protein